jgi:hypothetical protein
VVNVNVGAFTVVLLLFIQTPMNGSAVAIMQKIERLRKFSISGCSLI